MEILLRDVDKSNAVNSVVLDKLENTASRLTDMIELFMGTVGKLEKTMVSMQGEIASNRTETTEIKLSLDAMKNEFIKSENKSKIDVRLIWQAIFSKWLVYVFGGAGVGALITFLVTNWDKISAIFK